MKSPKTLIRPLVRNLHPYVPGEQPKVKGLVKLNTNENPYPPAPAVLTAVQKAVDDRLRLYPNPTSHVLREKLARLHGCKPGNIIVGNGSDELLAMAVRAFTEPAGSNASKSQSRVQFFHPSYSLYPVLAATHGAEAYPTPLADGFALPTVRELRNGKRWDFQAALTLVTTPNAPSGRGYRTQDLESICLAQKGVVVLDEAYVDFADEDSSALALKIPNVLVARTFSKAYSLCFQRVGYMIGDPVLIDALDRIRDTYNVNGLGQVAASATLDHLGYYRRNFAKIRATRTRLSQSLSELGFKVLPSQTNFILVEPPHPAAERWLDLLRAGKVLVRWFRQPEVSRYLRITIGTDREADVLLSLVRKILRRPPSM
ncbi:MAG: histidinol-phosphate transaminase [Verrucomicrobia bacterium]|nr:histidinol-phosphate transaminase [Verrucomicrobiota bacterium]